MGVQIASLATSFGASVCEVNDADELATAVADRLSDGVHVVVVRTCDRGVEVELLTSVRDAVRQAIDV